MDTTRYRVLSALELDHVLHGPGAEVDLTDQDAATLVKDGVVGPLAGDPADGESGAGARDGEPTRSERLRAVVAGLDPDDEDLWTSGRNRRPDLKALRREAGMDDITGAERDAAWEAHQESAGGEG